jgi:transcriptional regulator with XRE-family HTH domain
MNKKPESIRPPLVVKFGARMKEARELCGYSQVRAAKLLGYQNSSKLNRVELASDGNSISYWLPAKAAQVYQVSTDFLFGLADSWECSHADALQSQIAAAIQQSQSIQSSPVRQLYSLITAIEDAVSINLRRTAEFKDIVTRFRCLNAGFDNEMKLGAKLLRTADETSQEARRITRQLTNYHNSIQNSIFEKEKIQ